MHRRDFMAGALALPMLAKAGHARAESGPMTRIIFPFAAGGGGDGLCRQLAQYLPPVLDRNVIVENRTGGDGLIGIRAVKGASTDGTTILVTTGPTMYLLPMVETEPSFDTARDFVPVSQARSLRIRDRGEPVNRRKGFRAARGVAEGQSREGVLWRAEQRHYSAFHRLAARADPQLSMTRVPYRGSAPIVNDLIGGHLPFGITTLADAITQHRAGTVRIVAVSSAARSPFLNDVPTLKESGVDLVADGWYGMWLPAGSSPDFAKKLSAAVAEVLAKPEVKEKLLAVTLIPVGSTPEELTKVLAADTALWQPIVKATGYKITN